MTASLLKLLKIIKPITKLINKSFTTATFPDNLKIAEVSPLHKKNSTLDKSNYRSVSILPIISKLFERAINNTNTRILLPTFQHLPFSFQTRLIMAAKLHS